MPKLLIVLSALLGACTIAAQPPLPPGPGLCNDSALGMFVGQQASAELGARMLAQSGARFLR